MNNSTQHITHFLGSFISNLNLKENLEEAYQRANDMTHSPENRASALIKYHSIKQLLEIA